MIKADLAGQLKKAVDLPCEKYNELLADTDVVWEVSMRSGRKHKKYPRMLSKMKGIENNSNGNFALIRRMLHHINNARPPQNLAARKPSSEVQVGYPQN